MYALPIRVSNICVGTSDLLLAKHTPSVVNKSIFAHLQRVGLERYTAAFEFQGITNEKQFK
jgi:hypothetical protein